MIDGIMGILLVVVAAVIFVVWIKALADYEPNGDCCDHDCAACPFPSDGCAQKERGDKRK